MRDFRRYRVWQDAHALVLRIYELTSAFPPIERYSLTSQLRRAAVSVAANIAEGAARGSDADFARFVRIAASSATEVEYHLLLARDLTIIQEDAHSILEEQVVSVRRRLLRLHQRLKPGEPMTARRRSSQPEAQGP